MIITIAPTLKEHGARYYKKFEEKHMQCEDYKSIIFYSNFDTVHTFVGFLEDYDVFLRIKGVPYHRRKQVDVSLGKSARLQLTLRHTGPVNLGAKIDENHRNATNFVLYFTLNVEKDVQILSCL